MLDFISRVLIVPRYVICMSVESSSVVFCQHGRLKHIAFKHQKKRRSPILLLSQTIASSRRQSLLSECLPACSRTHCLPNALYPSSLTRPEVSAWNLFFERSEFIRIVGNYMCPKIRVTFSITKNRATGK